MVGMFLGTLKHYFSKKKSVEPVAESLGRESPEERSTSESFEAHADKEVQGVHIMLSAESL